LQCKTSLGRLFQMKDAEYEYERLANSVFILGIGLIIVESELDNRHDHGSGRVQLCGSRFGELLVLLMCIVLKRLVTGTSVISRPKYAPIG